MLRLYGDCKGRAPHSVEQLPGAGSNRTYYRMRDDGGASLIGVVGTSREENEAFIYLAGHFGQGGLPVPSVVAVSPSRRCYLQTDLGSRSLFDALSAGRGKGGCYSAEEKELLRRTIAELPRLQYAGAEGLDFGRCYPMASMDAMSVSFDLNYFKYCFLKTTGLDFNEVKLEKAFSAMAGDLTEDADRHVFQYRDFQARNVMLDKEGRPFFIDFQGGRRGPAEYDVASFLWQASAHYTPELRRELTTVYLNAARRYTCIDEERFRERMRLFVLFRTLQVLGAYGFRGYFERKRHFLDSIVPAVRNLREWLAEDSCPYTYLYKVLRRMAELPAFRPEHSVREGECRRGRNAGEVSETVSSRADTGSDAVAGHAGRRRLVVRVFSFSYKKKGIPDDASGNGGGYVFDCRGTHNPGRYERFKALTGLDEPVIRFLEEDGEILTFLDSVYKLADAHVECYLRRGFTDLMFAFGCTGGRHRSVYSAQRLAEHLHAKFGIEVRLSHREQGVERTFSPEEA